MKHGIMKKRYLGRAAKRARFSFDMKVLYYNRNRKKDTEEKLGVKYCEFEALIKQPDFTVLMTPLTKDTYHLIGFDEFKLMKETAIFINPSKGQTVNEEALIEAIQSKRILGAGLDVYEQEPINSDNPLLRMSNVVTVPHIGSSTNKTTFDMVMLAVANLVKALQGENPSCILPELRK